MDCSSLVSANCLNKGLFLLGDKNKQAQASPLKEDFRQLPGQVTGQVFQTTWRKEILPQLVYTTKQQYKRVLKELLATNVPEINQIQSVLRQTNIKQQKSTVNLYNQSMQCAKHNQLK